MTAPFEAFRHTTKNDASNSPRTDKVKVTVTDDGFAGGLRWRKS
jgi:hypothetical protein